MAMTRNVASFLAVLAMIMSVAKAASYTVGDSDGWSNTGVDYVAWAAKYTFQVDDKLGNFDSSSSLLPNHDVVEVSKTNYDACSIASPIATYTGGSTTITLTKSGNRYFICGTDGHCSQGQQLAIDTLASSSSPPPPAAKTPPPSSAYKLSYGASFGIALIMLAAI